MKNDEYNEIQRILKNKIIKTCYPTTDQEKAYQDGIIDALQIIKPFNEKNKKYNKVPPSYCSHRFNAQERKDLRNGKEIKLNDCLSKTGKLFSCKVHLEDSTSGDIHIVPNFQK